MNLNRKGFHIINLKSIYRPKNVGRLEIRDLQTMNWTLLSRWAYKWWDPQSDFENGA
jgi:hypothetical protein